MPRKVKTICQNLGNYLLGKNNTLTKDLKKCTPCDILYDFCNHCRCLIRFLLFFSKCATKNDHLVYLLKVSKANYQKTHLGLQERKGWKLFFEDENFWNKPQLLDSKKWETNHLW